ncbi:MAG: IS5 family transposase [Mycobacterium sp.]
MEDLGGRRTTELLKKLESAVPWEALAKLVRPLYRNDAVQGGRPPIAAVQMLKCLMLCKWFGLSDPQLEEQVNDRISFSRFVGLRAREAAPDETTMVNFRGRLREAGMFEELFNRLRRHLDEQGLIVREGTVVDATIIEQSRGRRREDGTSTRDPEASYTKKGGQIHHGYKLHTAVDLASGLIRTLSFTTAKVHDSRAIDHLMADEAHAVIADSAYDDADRRRRLQARGVLDGIMYKRRRGQAKLHPWQQRINRAVAKLRGRGELPFAWLKRFQGLARVRYHGLQRNADDAYCHALAFNCRRMLSVTK